MKPADSLRTAGLDAEHVELLTELDTALPPIVVHRPTMRVIDGMHRLTAATLHGRDIVDVVFFDGGEADAFVLAVERSTCAHCLRARPSGRLLPTRTPR